ncbi:MAG: DUF3368 domain-containing protein [Magnetococcales bacterium]|nr:DUF3368 domain-containing protein [Magnetococcales bacterium]
MAETAIINASPLIFLGRAGRLELLKGMVDHCFVPEPVRIEIFRRGENDRTVRALSMNPWIQVLAAPAIPETIAAWGLGAGESSVMALAMTCLGQQNTIAVIDDLAARHCAATLGIPVRGTLGLVLMARKRGLIPLARPVMEELIAHGMFLSRSVLDQAMSRVGE